MLWCDAGSMESSELGLFLVRTRKMLERLLRPEHDVLLKKMLFPKGEFRMRWFQCHFARERLLLFVRVERRVRVHLRGGAEATRVARTRHLAARLAGGRLQQMTRGNKAHKHTLL